MTGPNHTASGSVPSAGIQAAAAHAVSLVGEGARVGLGTGRAAAAFISLLGERVRRGLAVGGVATSAASARLARAAGIPLFDLEEQRELDLTVDGADEVAPNLDLIKGRGGALVKERIVAAASRHQVIVVGGEKLVGALGERGPLPIEVIPLAEPLVVRCLKELGLRPTRRSAVLAGGGEGGPATTENGNWIVDAALAAPLADAADARRLASAVRALPGVVDHGLFLGTADRVLVGHADGRVEIRERV